MTQMPPPVYGSPSGARPHRGTMILVFGILGIVCCIIFGILAWVMGSSDLKAMQRGEMDPSGEGVTRAGMICGIIGTILMALSMLAYLLAMLGAIALPFMAGGGGSGGGP